MTDSMGTTQSLVPLTVQATDIFSAWADGGVMVRNPSPYGGSWAWVHVNKDGDHVAEASGIVKPRPSMTLITNNLTEYIALLRCLEALPEGWEGPVHSDSQVTLQRFLRPYRGTDNLPDILVERVEAAQARLGKVEYVLVSGHPTYAELRAGIGKGGRQVSMHNAFCDNECRRVQMEYLAERSARV